MNSFSYLDHLHHHLRFLFSIVYHLINHQKIVVISIQRHFE